MQHALRVPCRNLSASRASVILRASLLILAFGVAFPVAVPAQEPGADEPAAQESGSSTSDPEVKAPEAKAPEAKDGSVGAETIPDTAVFPIVGEINTDRVNLRTGPSRDYRILRKLEPREKVVVKAEKGDWYEVTVPAGFTCFVLEELLDRTDPGAITVVEPRVNLRPTPSTRYFPAGQVRRGETVTALETTDGWTEIVPPERVSAWVAKTYVDIVGPVPSHREELDALSVSARRAYLGNVANPTAAVPQALRSEIEEKFRRAEGLYHAQTTAEAPDYSEAAELYREVAAQDQAPALAERARIRLESIEREVAAAATLREVQEIQSNLENQLAEAEREYERALEEQAEAPASSTRSAANPKRHVGWIVRNLQLNPFDQTTPAYRLVKGGKTLMLLSSYKYDLSDFVDRQVGLRGERADLEGLESPHTIVRSLEILSER